MGCLILWLLFLCSALSAIDLAMADIYDRMRPLRTSLTYCPSREDSISWFRFDFQKAIDKASLSENIRFAAASDVLPKITVEHEFPIVRTGSCRGCAYYYTIDLNCSAIRTNSIFLYFKYSIYPAGRYPDFIDRAEYERFFLEKHFNRTLLVRLPYSVVQLEDRPSSVIRLPYSKILFTERFRLSCERFASVCDKLHRYIPIILNSELFLLDAPYSVVPHGTFVREEYAVFDYTNSRVEVDSSYINVTFTVGQIKLGDYFFGIREKIYEIMPIQVHDTPISIQSVGSEINAVILRDFDTEHRLQNLDLIVNQISLLTRQNEIMQFQLESLTESNRISANNLEAFREELMISNRSVEILSEQLTISTRDLNRTVDYMVGHLKILQDELSVAKMTLEHFVVSSEGASEMTLVALGVTISVFVIDFIYRLTKDCSGCKDITVSKEFLRELAEVLNESKGLTRPDDESKGRDSKQVSQR